MHFRRAVAEVILFVSMLSEIVKVNHPDDLAIIGANNKLEMIS